MTERATIVWTANRRLPESEGEMVHLVERVIVSPVGGVFTPTVVGSHVDEGDVIGHVAVSGADDVAITSPFAGRLMEVVAWAGERLQPQQRVAWMRIAA